MNSPNFLAAENLRAGTLKLMIFAGETLLQKLNRPIYEVKNGQDTGKHYKAEEVLYDYLVNPQGFLKKKTGKKSA